MSEYHVIETLPEETQYEICLGAERVPQPEGDKQFNPNKTGDCFLCSSYVIIQYFCKQAKCEPPSMADVYHKAWAHPDIGAAIGSSYWATEKFWNQLNNLLDWYSLDFESLEDPPLNIISSYENLNDFGPRLYTASSLIKRVKVYLEAGYLIHTHMQDEPQRERAKLGKPPLGSTHQVVIDGFKTTTTKELSCSGPDYGAYWHGSYRSYLHVVDSSRKKPEPYWIDVDDWMADHGGCKMWFIKPTGKKQYSFPKNRECPMGHKRKI